MRAFSAQSALNNIEQLDSTLDSYDDEQDDLDKTVSDWETQVRNLPFDIAQIFLDGL